MFNENSLHTAIQTYVQLPTKTNLNLTTLTEGLKAAAIDSPPNAEQEIGQGRQHWSSGDPPYNSRRARRPPAAFNVWTDTNCTDQHHHYGNKIMNVYRQVLHTRLKRGDGTTICICIRTTCYRAACSSYDRTGALHENSESVQNAGNDNFKFIRVKVPATVARRKQTSATVVTIAPS